MIGDPILFGATHCIVTFEPDTVVVGAAGCAGI